MPRLPRIPICHPDRKNYSHGLCKSCWVKQQYHNNPEYREKFKARVKKSRKKRMMQDPDWNARRQREFRKKYPDKFNYIMARFYFRKLSQEDKEKLIGDVEK